jgi:ribulose-phosphate 3-epimerase
VTEKITVSKKKLFAASILSADFTRLGKEIEEVEAAGADWIHFDITDGHFVPNLTMGIKSVQAARRSTDLPLDIHLMIERPDTFVPMFADAGADYISVHFEASRHLNRTVQTIRNAGVRAGVALGPATPIEPLRWVMEYVDYILLLSVNPGFGGQSYIPNVLTKATELAKLISETGRDILIQADGGINIETIGAFSQAGVDVFVIGSALFESDDYAATLKALKQGI